MFFFFKNIVQSELCANFELALLLLKRGFYKRINPFMGIEWKVL